MYLVDTNVWLERLLDQARASEVGEFLARVPPGELCLTDFTFHSIGVIMTRLGCLEGFLAFAKDTLVDGQVAVVRLHASDMERLTAVCRLYHLDFDDAYQYVACEKYNLTLVSLDGDFDRTERGRKQPAEILASRPDVIPAEQG